MDFHSFRMGCASVKFFVMTKLRVLILLLLQEMTGSRADAALSGT